MPSSNRISVVIPHLNQPDSLARCLDSLRAQTGDFTLDAITVVDNGSREMPAKVCAERQVALLREDTPGPGPARNTGVAQAAGGILAFIDADCTADPGWLAAIARTFDENPSATILGGDVRIRRQRPDTATAIEAYESVYAYRMGEYIARQGFTGTGNLAIRRPVLETVGPFGGIEIAEDRDWGHRALARGFRTRYVPGMIVYHPARSSFAELARKWDRHIAHDFERFAGKPFGRLRWVVRAAEVAVSPVFEIPRILRSDRIRGAGERWSAFLCLIRIRAYRARRMLRLAVTGAGREMSGAWNRR